MVPSVAAILAIEEQTARRMRACGGLAVVGEAGVAAPVWLGVENAVLNV